jgi:uncharacterized membrane protein
MDDRLPPFDWNLALYALSGNAETMSWNLFLATLPLVLSFVLFNPLRSPVLWWSLWLLLAITAAGGLAELPMHLMHTLHHHWLQSVGGVFVISWIVLSANQLRKRQNHANQSNHHSNPVIRSWLWWLGFVLFILFLPNAAYVLTDVIHLVIDIRQGYSLDIVMLALIPQYLLFVLTGFEAYVVSMMNLGHFLRSHGLAKITLATELIIHGLCALGVYLGRFDRFNSWDAFTHPHVLLQRTAYLLTSDRDLPIIIVMFIVFTAGNWLLRRLTVGLMLQKRAFPPYD